jgi:hypothetical protein
MKFSELTLQVGTWADANFEVHLPDLGFLEELGEATHCILKKAQGIRGFDAPEVFEAEFKDALADMTIYLAHWCYMNKLSVPDCTVFIDWKEESKVLEYLCNVASSMLACQHNGLIDRAGTANSALLGVTSLAACYKINLMEECVIPTWDKVSKRNWKKNPLDAHKHQA